MILLDKPFPRSYWVVPGRFLAGAYPGSRDRDRAGRKIGALLKCGIVRIINLMEEGECDSQGGLFADYESLFQTLGAAWGREVSVIRYPIRDLTAPSPDVMNRILDEIDFSIVERMPVYVHCRGGRGRTGTVVGCFWVRRGLNGREALAVIEDQRRGTPDDWLPSPETPEQYDLVLSWIRLDRRYRQE